MMKILSFRFAPALAGAALWLAPLDAQSEPVRYRALPGKSLLSIKGTSTVHDWEVKTRLVAGSMEWDDSFPLDPSRAELPALTKPPKVNVIIPVRDIESGKQRMNEVMHAAMNAVEHKYARYALRQIKLADKARKAGDPIVFDTTGELLVNGKKVAVPMQVSVKALDGGKLSVRGQAKVKMTDFGIQPPAPKIALGLIKTGDEVTVTFDWVVAKK